MVHKNYKSNLSKEKGRRLIFNMIDTILKERKDQKIHIDELHFLLNNRTKNMSIMNNTKKKNMSNFIKVVFGGLINFIDNYDDFLLQIKNSNTLIRLNKLDISDWVFIEDNYE